MTTSSRTNAAAAARGRRDGALNASRIQAAIGRQAAWRAITTCHPCTGTGDAAAAAHRAASDHPA